MRNLRQFQGPGSILDSPNDLPPSHFPPALSDFPALLHPPDLDQAANQLGNPPAKSGRFEDSMDGVLERKEALQSWFAELSESQRQTLHLFFFEGCTFDEIAARQGQTAGNARNHYYRGLDKLRKQISAGKLPGKEAV